MSDGGLLEEFSIEAGELLEEAEESLLNIESGADLTIKATGDITIEGTNVEITANAEFKADGGAGASVTSSAITTIEGSLVNIN